MRLNFRLLYVKNKSLVKRKKTSKKDLSLNQPIKPKNRLMEFLKTKNLQKTGWSLIYKNQKVWP